MCRIIFTKIFLKARYDDGGPEGGGDHWRFWHKKYITACLKFDRPGLDNVGSSTSHNPIGLHRLLRK
jgi:hypothetical protein